MVIKKFNEFINEKKVHIEYDYANKKLPNKVPDIKDYKYEDQGWFLYHKNLLNPYAKKPPKNGIYNVKSDFGYKVRTDIAKYENGKFKKSKEFNLPDDQITHWKIKETDDIEYKYDFDTGKFLKK